jgi:protein TonB
MFDLIAGGPRHPYQNRTITTQAISVAIHALVLGATLIIPLLFATEKMPLIPTMMAYVAAPVAPPPPPPPPPPPAAPAARAAEVKPATPVGNPNAAPVEPPREIAAESAMPESFGVEGGVEGGVVGGSLGGFVGGLLEAPPPPPPPPPPPAQPVRIGGQIKAPALLKRVEPIYPDIAVLAKVTGTVILEATVATDGSVQSVTVLRSVKFLDQPAIDAVKQWRYSPLVLNGLPTPFVLTVTLTFSIK